MLSLFPNPNPSPEVCIPLAQSSTGFPYRARKRVILEEARWPKSKEALPTCCGAFNLKNHLKKADGKYCKWGVWRGDRRRCKVVREPHSCAVWLGRWREGAGAQLRPLGVGGLTPTQRSPSESIREGREPLSIGWRDLVGTGGDWTHQGTQHCPGIKASVWMSTSLESSPCRWVLGRPQSRTASSSSWVFTERTLVGARQSAQGRGASCPPEWRGGALFPPVEHLWAGNQQAPSRAWWL